ncbi:MAG: hypothetical protein JJT75_10220 [Opitutales bacterium]|nr:hypothetical protein [Opitutales bacterium]MCH8540583.1 hypothetical protein [Opitutales bacterium]
MSTHTYALIKTISCEPKNRAGARFFGSHNIVIFNFIVSMKASTKLFLWELFALTELMMSPSPRRLGQTFEGWAHRRGHLRKIHRLEAEAFLEKLPGGSGDRIYRLTSKGKAAALGGKDPTQLWSRNWDGIWRLLLFDLPTKPKTPRNQLQAFLRNHDFGCLQGSVWISPDPVGKIRKKLKGYRHPSSLLLFEGHPAGKEKPGEIVKEAWDFDEINQCWNLYANCLSEMEKFLQKEKIDHEIYNTWRKEEFALWLKINDRDPFLPQALHPKNYNGPKVWKKKLSLWTKLAPKLLH